MVLQFLVTSGVQRVTTDIGNRPEIEDKGISDGNIKDLGGHSIEWAHPWDVEKQ